MPLPTLPNFNARKFTLFASILLLAMIAVLLLLAFLAPKPQKREAPALAPTTQLPTAPQIPLPAAKLPSTQELPLPSAVATEALPPDGATSIALAPDGRSLLGYNSIDGSLYRLDENGNLIVLSDDRFPFARAVTWSQDRSKAILEFPDEAKVLYDLSTKKATTLPRHWKEFTFSPGSDAIAFKSLGRDANSQWLATAAPDGSRAVPVEELGDRAFLVRSTWSPNGQVIGLFTKPLDQTRSTLFFLGPRQESYPSAIVDGTNLVGTWSPDGNTLLYSTATAATNWRPSLSIIGASGAQMGRNRTTLGLQTWADKCAFRPGVAEKILCAVPAELPDGAGLVRESVERTQDVFVEIDLKTGLKRVPTAEVFGTIEEIVLSKDGSSAFVRERESSRVKKINL